MWFGVVSNYYIFKEKYFYLLYRKKPKHKTPHTYFLPEHKLQNA